MAWYYWLYIVIAMVWFFDLYSTMIRLSPQNFYADVVLKPIFIAVLSAVWPIALVVLIVKSRKAKQVASSD
jgi:hypothetical protein